QAKDGNTQTKRGRSRREEEGELFREAEKEAFGIGFPEEDLDSFYGDAADPDALLEEHTHTMLLNFENPFDHGKERWTLQPVREDSPLLPIPLEGDSFLIGQKGGPADVGIADQTVSRIHARVFQRNGSWFLTDMSSRNGTSVNGKKAVGREEIPLSDGAVVSFARCEYKVCME
ncbi:MAG: FHA domain-containing protein, partial [Lachnospiraceae bacterium]|nr:FHA domain-containing protein [Lachnospiraceae bacterium]